MLAQVKFVLKFCHSAFGIEERKVELQVMIQNVVWIFPKNVISIR